MTTAAPVANLTASGLYHGWMPTPDRRGTTDLLWSCLSTITLCVWTAIHLPVPYCSREKPKFSEDWRNWLRQKVIRSRLVPALVTFVIPEFLAFMAVQEFVKARSTRKSLDLDGIGLIHSFFLNMGGFCLRSPDGTLFQLDFDILWEAYWSGSDYDDASATTETFGTTHSEGTCYDSEDLCELGDVGIVNDCRSSYSLDIARVPDEVFFTSHVGGTWYDSESLSELSDSSVVSDYRYTLHRARPLGRISAEALQEVFITGLEKFREDDIKALSKADSMTKTIACFQALWFVTQVISRVVQGRAVTLLEVSTCAYVFSASIAYLAWWKKPQNCSVPLMIDCPDDMIARLPVSGYQDAEGIWAQYIWGGASWDRPELSPLLLTLSFYTIPLCFGAIHVAAWKITLPSEIEIWMWRSSTVICCGLPLLGSLASEMWFLVTDRRFSSGLYGLTRHLGPFEVMVFAVYAAVRLYMIAEVLISMRSLPLSAFDTVNWSAAVPHI